MGRAMTPCILAIETSTDICSIALSHNGTIFDKVEMTPRGHTKYLLPMIDQLLAEHKVAGNQLTAIAFGCGPGSFTGLRVAAGAVQGLAFGWDVPVIPISTLQALAYRAVLEQILEDDSYIVPILDARMSEVYWGVYHWVNNQLLLVDEERVSPPENVLFSESLLAEKKRTFFVGSGQCYADKITLPPKGRWLEKKHLQPQAKQVAQLALQLCLEPDAATRMLDASLATPIYLRNKVAWKKSC